MRSICTVALVLALGACAGSGGSDGAGTPATAPPDTAGPVTAADPSPPVPTSGAAPDSASQVEPSSPAPIEVEMPLEPLLEDSFDVVEELARDELRGRDNGTDGSSAARDILLSRLVGVVEPASGRPGAAASLLQPYGDGTNIVGILPGRGALADEYVLVGAHYDHLGECDVRGEPDDVICNGAADNAAGVGVVFSILNSVSYVDVRPGSDGPPRRSLIVGLWDGEEDGLVGSQAYVDDPQVPLASTVASVNFDIQGAQLSPALATTTLLIGPETGGAALVDAARRATDAASLDYATFSLAFGQGRSDHASFVAAGVPTVFFTDASNGCYHTVLDDVAHLDREKFYRQVGAAQSLVDDLLTMEAPPTFEPGEPPTAFADAVMMLDLRDTAAMFFKNAGTGRHNMVYRRHDGSIGWVEPR